MKPRFLKIHQVSKPLGVFVCSGAICLNAGPAHGSILADLDPFIGTGYHGHTFPGATTPFGMVQLSPDTRTSGWDACGGY